MQMMQTLTNMRAAKPFAHASQPFARASQLRTQRPLASPGPSHQIIKCPQINTGPQQARQPPEAPFRRRKQANQKSDPSGNREPYS
mmetsp:Transcript_9350/g.25187  ORF Transcript_9350/g.25187 Transcript_9350/m.25187 type:complete len:86 (-) Transcript_9350:715-972(-)|eukprot:1159623-Pelagomonas_calceolata.AAC.15